MIINSKRSVSSETTSSVSATVWASVAWALWTGSRTVSERSTKVLLLTVKIGGTTLVEMSDLRPAPLK